MGKIKKKSGVKADNSARISRGAARKARNAERNGMARLRNEELAQQLRLTVGHGKERASKVIRSALRAAARLELESVILTEAEAE